MRVLDLFSGIGGFSLGLERAGMETVAFCEIDKFCQKVLKKHWPDVPVFNDVRTLPDEFKGTVDVICGGFPCQDISVAGKQKGITGERSGLWKEFAKIIDKFKPSFVIIENVSALVKNGLSTVLQDLAVIGYDAEWHNIYASSVGMGHPRSRLWIVAYPTGKRRPGILYSFLKQRIKQAEIQKTIALDTSSNFDERSRRDVDRLRALGNAVVPQIPEIIGRAIMEAAI